MNRRTRSITRLSRVLLATVVTTSFLVLGVGTGTAEAQSPPVWCEWIPPELLPFIPECQGDGGGGEPGGPVEEKYSDTGPSAVTTERASAPGTPGVMLVYPSDLGAEGYDHPILTWGNGTIGDPDPCGATEGNGGPFSHLASWGYVVVCANTGWSGSGNEILAAANWLVDQDSNPGSVFFDKLDTDKVGAFGGSQGASGAVNAMNKSDGLIDSTWAWALTDPWAHIWGAPPDMTQVDNPVFLASGNTDWLTLQPQQQTYYDQISGPAAKAALVNTGHESGGNDIGYAIAWFKYTLEGDDFARSAFVGNSPEIASNSNWTNWASKNLP